MHTYCDVCYGCNRYEVEMNRFRLEATFYEMALNYYSKQVKKIRISKVQ